MRPFYNAPQLWSAPTPKRQLTPEETILKLEDTYYEYREGASQGYYDLDDAVVVDFRTKIAALKAAL